METDELELYQLHNLPDSPLKDMEDVFPVNTPGNERLKNKYCLLEKTTNSATTSIGRIKVFCAFLVFLIVLLGAGFGYVTYRLILKIGIIEDQIAAVQSQLNTGYDSSLNHNVLNIQAYYESVTELSSHIQSLNETFSRFKEHSQRQIQEQESEVNALNRALATKFEQTNTWILRTDMKTDWLIDSFLSITETSAQSYEELSMGLKSGSNAVYIYGLQANSSDKMPALPINASDELTVSKINSSDELTALRNNSTDEQNALPMNSRDEPNTLPMNSHDELTAFPMNSTYEGNTLPMNSNDELTALPKNSMYERNTLPMNSSDELTSLPKNSTYERNTLPMNTSDELTALPNNSTYERNTLPMNSSDELTALPIDYSDERNAQPMNSSMAVNALPMNSSEEFVALKVNSSDYSNVSSINSTDKLKGLPVPGIETNATKHSNADIANNGTADIFLIDQIYNTTDNYESVENSSVLPDFTTEILTNNNETDYLTTDILSTESFLLPKQDQNETTYSRSVNGNWTEWSLWSKCSVSCGKGQMLRVRSCSNPVPENNGADCEGSDREAKICRAISCPVHGGWSIWSNWSTCSSSCGPGIRHRVRRCNNPSPSLLGRMCDGESSEYEACSVKSCSVDGQWSTWSV